MDILAARTTDDPAIRGLLEAADLPTQDLTPSLLAHFLVARDGDMLVGAVGLEPAGDTALLRSLVVADAARDRGIGDELVRAIERAARAKGLRALYLLTTTADGYFARRGYTQIDRAVAPVALHETPQFKTLCPSSSVVMTKTL
jgi:amino-acid N-acetyltransferase